VLAAQDGRDLQAVYYYFRSLGVPSPFHVAKENLIQLFEKVGQCKTHSPPPSLHRSFHLMMLEMVMCLLAETKGQAWKTCKKAFCLPAKSQGGLLRFGQHASHNGMSTRALRASLSVGLFDV